MNLFINGLGMVDDDLFSAECSCCCNDNYAGSIARQKLIHFLLWMFALDKYVPIFQQALFFVAFAEFLLPF